jgi:uncharacterized alkaline shock family protein YloU
MQGTITIAPSVLATIVELTALATPGVAKLYRQGRLAALRSGGPSEGVRVTLEGTVVDASLSIVAEASVNLQELGRTVQQRVARAVADLAGLSVGAINVYIQDVEAAL